MCSFCGLFGAHKGHELVLISDLRQQTREVLQEVRGSLETLTSDLAPHSELTLTQTVHTALRQRLADLRDEMESEYNVPSTENQSESEAPILDAI